MLSFSPARVKSAREKKFILALFCLSCFQPPTEKGGRRRERGREGGPTHNHTTWRNYKGYSVHCAVQRARKTKDKKGARKRKRRKWSREEGRGEIEWLEKGLEFWRFVDYVWFFFSLCFAYCGRRWGEEVVGLCIFFELQNEPTVVYAKFICLSVFEWMIEWMDGWVHWVHKKTEMSGHWWTLQFVFLDPLNNKWQHLVWRDS